MATTEAALYAVAKEGSARPTVSAGAWISAGLTVVAVAIHGYHPYAEDGGVYLAGIEKLLHPQLFPSWSGFVTTHLKFSLFAPMIASVARVTHIGLMPTLLLIYLVSVWLTLFAGWLLASRCVTSTTACLGAVTMLAMALTIPVAGTSLMLIDPYVTARSISTPCAILMLAGAIDLHADWSGQRATNWRGIALFTGSFALAAAMHPLMAAYALGCVLLFLCVSISNRMARIAATTAMCIFGFALAGCVERLSPADSAAYVEVAHSRAYWFLSTWHWYELLGLAGPPLVLLMLSWRNESARDSVERRLAWMAILAGAAATLVALCFARMGSRSYEVAKLQPLRIYQTIYLLLLLAAGAALAERVLKRHLWRWLLMVLLIGGAMLFVQSQTFPHSAHVELPGRTPANLWEQAFQWVRVNTPQEALFALDANYISAADEDSQNFRAIAERSALPDYSKDGGIASIAPTLTLQWLAGQTAQTGLDHGIGSDAVARLRRYGVNWIVLTRQAPVSFSCSYANGAVKVCRLP